MRSIKPVAAILALAGLLVVGTSGVAAAKPAGGALTAFTSGGPGAKSPILFVGAIGDHGTSTSIDKNGKVDANGSYVKIVLKKGTFEVNAVALNNRLNKLNPTVDKATCSATATGSGPVSVSKGTGLYAGISGTLKATVTFAFIGPLFTSGAQKGQCNLGNNAQPIAQYSSIVVTGHVSF
jgi:hypothetical protein